MINRREFIRRFVVVSVLVGTSFAGFGELASLVRSNRNAAQLPTLLGNPTTSGSQPAQGQTSSSVSAPAGYTYVATLAQLAGKTYAYFNHPSFGTSILLSVGGQWKAFSATCTHRTCTFDYQNSEIYCPCHGGTFDPTTGAVTGGPPPSPLPEFSVEILNSNVFVSTNRVN